MLVSRPSGLGASHCFSGDGASQLLERYIKFGPIAEMEDGFLSHVIPEVLK